MADVDKNDQLILDHAIACSLYDYDVQVAAAASAVPSSHSSSEDASQAVISCDVCERSNALSDCFLDMLGCNHFLCLSCHATAKASASDSLTSCPVRGCHGFFFAQRPSPDFSSTSHPSTSSSPPSSSSLFYCAICMEHKQETESFLDIEGCSHVYCRECIAAYVAAKVEENEPTIMCPHIGCGKGRLELQSCLDTIAPKVFDRWGALLCEASIPGAVYCPYKDCSALLVNDEGADVTESECPHCDRVFCAQCRVPWHTDVSCEKYRALGKEKEEQMKLKEVADENGWKRCPKCGSYVERVEGCVFIMCRCKHCFCYLCLAPMNPKDNRHYCTKCKLTWDKKK